MKVKKMIAKGTIIPVQASETLFPQLSKEQHEKNNKNFEEKWSGLPDDDLHHLLVHTKGEHPPMEKVRDPNGWKLMVDWA
jgi:hypothetical protein